MSSTTRELILDLRLEHLGFTWDLSVIDLRLSACVSACARVGVRAGVRNPNFDKCRFVDSKTVV